MANRKRTPNNFEDRFFDLLEGTINGIDEKVDKLALGQDVTNSRLDKLERRVFKTRSPIPWYSDRVLLYLALGSIFLFISIVAASRGIGVPKLP